MTQHATRTKEASPSVVQTNQTERSRGTGVAASRRPGPAPLAAAGNQTVQRLFAKGAIQPKLRVGSSDDPAEREAGQLANHVVGGTACTCAAESDAPCPACARKGEREVRRKARRGERHRESDVSNLSLGDGRPLGTAERAFFEARLGTDLGDVRVHADESAARTADSVNARAFTLGDSIAFAGGEYRPHSRQGRLLLAHELAHVLQQRESPSAERETIRRDDATTASLVSEPEPQVCLPPEEEQAPQVCEAAAGVVSGDPGQPASLNLTGTAGERIAAFKQLVRTTAVHRLHGNKRNLALWTILVEQAIPAVDLTYLSMAQSGASRPYMELQDIRDPGVRELRAHQAFGQYRACTGCHIETRLWGTREERRGLGGAEWLSPTERRAGATWSEPFPSYSTGAFFAGGGFGTATAAAPAQSPLPAPDYRPTSGTQEARLHGLFPDPEAVREGLKRVAPIIDELGPEKYKVLPEGFLSELASAESPELVRRKILDTIAQRQSDYSEATTKIEAGELGYEHFGPIIRDLLPLADEEVRNAIQEEMDDKAFWDKVEAVVVGILTVAALILTIFPPTTALGIAALASLELTLGIYGVQKGIEMQEVGGAYRLMTGAHDVLTRDQQAAGDAMVFGGFLQIALGSLSAYTGAFRAASLLPRGASLAQSAGGLLRTGQTVQRGEYLLTLGADGSLTVSSVSRPDLLFIIRGETATLYQSMGPGGMRVLASRPISAVAPEAAAAPRLLTTGEEAALAVRQMSPGGAARGGPGIPYEGHWPHITQKAPDWCGAACGEMAAGRLGTRVTQEELAATHFFDKAYIVEEKVIVQGGFQTKPLAEALEEVAKVPGRTWFGGQIKQDISTAARLRQHLGGYLQASESSIILRVRGGDHWIIVDEVTSKGLIAIRDPAAKVSTLVTADELAAMRPTADIVISFKKP